jgi:hypothetical protein
MIPPEFSWSAFGFAAGATAALALVVLVCRWLKVKD